MAALPARRTDPVISAGERSGIAKIVSLLSSVDKRAARLAIPAPQLRDNGVMNGFVAVPPGRAERGFRPSVRQSSRRVPGMKIIRFWAVTLEPLSSR